MLTRVVAPAVAALALVATLGAPAANAAKTPAPRDATYASVLSARIPCPLNAYYPHLGCGRMKNGRLKLAPGNSPYAHIEVKDIDTTWKRTSVRFVDVAGSRHKEAVVLISANDGGVSWPNYVIVYDGHGNVLSKLDVGEVSGDARERTTFSTSRANSVDVRTSNIPRGAQPSCCGTGTDLWRLSKGPKDKPRWQLITRR